ncbi:hypothetical protein D3C72_2318720 [compost metagenome]
MRIKDVTLGVRVSIIDGHWKGRIGTVIAIGTRTVLLDIGEPMLISELPEHLEPTPEDPLPPGWEEFDI